MFIDRNEGDRFIETSGEFDQALINLINSKDTVANSKISIFQQF